MSIALTSKVGRNGIFNEIFTYVETLLLYALYGYWPGISFTYRIMDRRNHKRERQTDRYSDIDVVSHSTYNESNRDVSVLSPNRQQDVDKPSPY